jgi:hypothetical protein
LTYDQIQIRRAREEADGFEVVSICIGDVVSGSVPIEQRSSRSQLMIDAPA